VNVYNTKIKVTELKTKKSQQTQKTVKHLVTCFFMYYINTTCQSITQHFIYTQ